MGSSAHLIMDNFIWKMETITPTNKAVKHGFTVFDPERESPPLNSKGLRWFYISTTGENPPSQTTYNSLREAWHAYQAHIFYPLKALDYRKRHKMYMQDRDDIWREVRAQAARYGYDKDNTATDIGIMLRIPDGSTIANFNDQYVEVVMQFLCHVKESEL